MVAISGKLLLLEKIFNYKVAQNLILNNFVIESFVKILLVWPLLRRCRTKLFSLSKPNLITKQENRYVVRACSNLRVRWVLLATVAPKNPVLND